MKSLIESNIYEFDENIIIVGSCMKNVYPNAFNKLIENADLDDIYSVCLEGIHMNMVAHKIASILRIAKVKKLTFASVDKSPHCVQLHYIRNELEKIMDLSNIEIKNYVVNDDELLEIPSEIISLSKNLSKLTL